MSLLHRALTVAFVSSAALLVPAAAQAAPTYPPAGNSITVDTTSPTVGSTVDVSAKVFEPGSDVDVTTAVDGGSSDSATTGLRAPGSTGGGRLGTSLPLAAAGDCETGSTCTVTADADGVATASVTLTAAGTTTVTFEGVGVDGEPLVQTVELTVGAAAATPDQATPSTGGLADTGPRDLVQTIVIGFALLAAGTAMVLIVRRRRDSVSPA